MNASAPEVLVVTPPVSPHDAGPPAGPAVLKAHLESRGIRTRTVDLNIRYLREFAGGSQHRLTVVGDHAKDRRRVDAARTAFGASLALPAADPATVPCGVDPVLSLPHTFAEIATALEDKAARATWNAFLAAHLFDHMAAPRVLGISVMGPAQVLPAMHIARVARQRWPGTLIVVGGSHITLLADAIAADARYQTNFDGFLVGHAEGTLADAVRALRRGEAPALLLAGARAPGPIRPLPPSEWTPPRFEADELGFYDQRRLSLPLQLSRGCSYGRCRMCTYPAVEELVAAKTGAVARRFLSDPILAGAARLSVKDSLMEVPSMRAFARVVAEAAPGAIWSATTKLCRALDGQAFRDLHAQGLRTVELGVETIHPRLQALIDKPQSLALIEGVIAAAVGAGVSVVVNLIYGFPSETADEARRQLDWFRDLQAAGGGLVNGSHNLLEINRGSEFARNPRAYGIELGAIGPWAFSHTWNAPAWRRDFAETLRALDGEPCAHEEVAA
jgi:hypothetical protein